MKNVPREDKLTVTSFDGKGVPVIKNVKLQKLLEDWKKVKKIKKRKKRVTAGKYLTHCR